MIGVEQENNKNICKHCKRELNFQVNNIFNFCPFCANPLNIASYNLQKEKEKSIQLQTLHLIQKSIKDNKDLIEFSKIANEIMKK